MKHERKPSHAEARAALIVEQATGGRTKPLDTGRRQGVADFMLYLPGRPVGVLEVTSHGDPDRANLNAQMRNQDRRPRTDPASAADAAWAASDLLFAAAHVVDGRRGGPLTDAAEAYDRAARELHGRNPRPTEAGHGLRRAAALLLDAGALLTRQQELPQLAALLIQLTALVRAVDQLRQSQHRAAQAQAARAAADGLDHLKPTVLASWLGGPVEMPTAAVGHPSADWAWRHSTGPPPSTTSPPPGARLR